MSGGLDSTSQGTRPEDAHQKAHTRGRSRSLVNNAGQGPGKKKGSTLAQALGRQMQGAATQAMW